jgi:hypothetical protein
MTQTISDLKCGVFFDAKSGKLQLITDSRIDLVLCYPSFVSDLIIVI